MKKKSSVLLCILLVSVLGGVTAFAAQTPSPEQTGGTISIDSASSVAKGQQVSLAVRVSGVPNPGLLSYQLQLEFDYSVIQIEEIRPGDAPFNSPVVSGSIATANSSGSISFGQFVTGNQGLSNGVLAYVVVRAVGNSGSSTSLNLSIANNSCGCLIVSNGRLTIAYGDCDGDGIPDDEEGDLGTNPCIADTDGDGLDDNDEITLGTNPLNPDTDQDDLLDGFEVDYVCLNPLKRDTDNDTLTDGEEIHETGSNPCKSDTDSDGINDNLDDCPNQMEDGLPPMTNDGCVGHVTGGDPPLYNNIQVFPTPEKSIGQDLNKNNSTHDTVLRYRNIQTGEVINTGISVSGSHASVDIYENIIVFVGGDNKIGYLHMNGGKTVDLGRSGSHPVVYGNTIAFESFGTIYIYNISTRALTPTQAQGSEPVIFGNLVAYRGNGSKSTIQYLNVNTGHIVDTKQIGSHPAIYAETIAFATNERDVNQDLNGSGRVDNFNVVRYYNISSARVENTASVGDYPVLYGNQIAFSTKESAIGQDLNGDGKTQGEVIRFYDITTGTLYNTKELGTEPDIFQGKISYYVWENWATRDMNGDGDIGDPVLGLFDTRSAAATPSTPVAPSTPANNTSKTSTGVQQFDSNNNKLIEDAEFFTALDQWVASEIGNELFFELVDAWVSGAPIRSSNVGFANAALSVRSSGSSINFSVSGASLSSMQVAVYDLQGRQVFAGQANGTTLRWNMLSSDGKPLANGVYFYVVSAANGDQTWKSEVKRLSILR